ncbi:MAG: UDP-N-acetylmuramate dehydrogenase [Aquificae bacterium]|nr:UDP-N-acetylmuramate dehydrogenase [Aquificota bacterium]
MKNLYRDFPLAPLTTARVGQRARRLFRPSSVGELKELLPKLAAEDELFFLGGGSNTLFGNFKGCVVWTDRLRWVKVLNPEGDEVLIEAGAGTPLSELLKPVLELNLTGLEGLFGIPRITVGGAAAMNAGAYGFEVGPLVRRVRYLTPEGDLVEEESPPFGYRSSPFPRKGIIVSVLLGLKKADFPVAERVRELNRRRKKSQPLHLPTAGSTFKNPKGFYAGRLLEEVGLKGFCTEGGLCFWKGHANFLVNLSGSATLSEVLYLLELAKERVLKSFGVLLEEEVRLVGDP